MKNWGVAKW